MYENLYGLSCLENQILGILKINGIDINKFYKNSYISTEELYKCVFIEKQKLQHFNGVAKIQDELKNSKVIDLTKLKQTNFLMVKEELDKCKFNEYILIRITADYVKKVFFARGLRNDHFVWFMKKENIYYLYNDIPEIQYEFNLNETFYDNEYFKLVVYKDKLIKFSNSKSINKINFIEKINFNDLLKINENEFIDYLINFILILKTLRSRIKMYYSDYYNTDFFAEYIIFLEKQCYLINYYKLKKSKSLHDYLNIFKNIVDEDEKYINKLINIKENLL